MLARLIEGMIYQAASNLHWDLRGGYRKDPKVADAAFTYLLEYNHQEKIGSCLLS